MARGRAVSIGSRMRATCTPLPRRSAAVSATVLALVFGACSDELDEFRDDLRPLEDRAAQQRSAISAQLHSLTLGSRADVRELRAGSRELEKTYDEIAELSPPDSYERPFASYVQANDRTISGLERFAARVAAGDAAGVRRAGRAVVQELSRSQRARLRWLE